MLPFQKVDFSDSDASFILILFQSLLGQATDLNKVLRYSSMSCYSNENVSNFQCSNQNRQIKFHSG